jgi:CheY-like chemotaxis protein/histone H3/H4
MATRILLADDSITIQKVVNLTFADEGIEVVAVSNGDLAERRLAEVAPDLVLADIFMPGKNGYELCEAIKDNPQFRNVPVVLLVGAFEPFDQVEARRVRADAHLTKPFESRTLVETVRRLISASSQITTGPIAPMPAADEEHDEALDALAPVTAAAPLSNPLAGKLDPSAMMADSAVAPSTPPNRTTGELASPVPDAQREAFDLGVADAPALDAASATLTDTTERFEPLELSSNGDYSHDNVAPAFDLDAEEMIGDFDMSEPVETAASHDPVSFETEPSPVLDVDISGAGEGEDWFDSTSFETKRLDRPSGDSAWQAPATRSALSYQSPDFRLQTEGAMVASEASTETACATLLAVDEPLGDVLFDEAVSGDPLALSEMLSGDSLALELTEPEVAEARRSESTQFNLVDIGADSTPEELFTIEETTPAEVYVTAEEPTPPADPPDSVVAGLPPDMHPASDDVAHLDWTTPRAAANSTAQLDSVVMPIDVAEYLPENSAAENPQQTEKAEEASFATSTTWTEEEARFTPIDIEAAEVEEASAEEVSAAETGFAFSSLPDEQPPASSETPVASAAQEQARESPTTYLSAAAIEEIVRRVVAEMSESVVREVAWEVVPDCVERVIEQLTRESLSKRA